jgi:hypothetical protein
MRLSMLDVGIVPLVKTMDQENKINDYLANSRNKRLYKRKFRKLWRKAFRHLQKAPWAREYREESVLKTLYGVGHSKNDLTGVQFWQRSFLVQTYLLLPEIA